MDIRKELMPGLGWDSFFDKAVQKELEAQRQPPPQSTEASASRFELAWPLIAWQVTEDFVNFPDSREVAVEFAEVYELHPEFAANLLLAVTLFHHLPEAGWPVERVIAEASSRVAGNFRSQCDYTKEDSFLFSPSDFLDGPGLIKRLAAGKDQVSQWLWHEFSEAAKKLLRSPSLELQKKCAALAVEFNKAMRTPAKIPTFFVNNAAWHKRQILEENFKGKIAKRDGQGYPKQPQNPIEVPFCSKEIARFSRFPAAAFEEEFANFALLDCKQLADVIRVFSPSLNLKHKRWSGEELRKGPLYREKSRRRKIEEHWRANFEARKYFERDNWATKLSETTLKVVLGARPKKCYKRAIRSRG